MWRVGKVADVERDRCKEPDLGHLPLRKEAFSDSPLIEHFDRACVQTAFARSGDVLIFAPLDDGDVDPRKRQLCRQHQARRTSSGDHHCMIRHGHTASCVVHFRSSASVVFRVRPATVRHDLRLAASPRLWHRLEVERGGGRSPLIVPCVPPRRKAARQIRRYLGPGALNRRLRGGPSLASRSAGIALAEVPLPGLQRVVATAYNLTRSNDSRGRLSVFDRSSLDILRQSCISSPATEGGGRAIEASMGARWSTCVCIS